jgi:hypothetical protein
MTGFGAVKVNGDSLNPIVTSPLKEGLVIPNNLNQDAPFTFFGVIGSNGSIFNHGLFVMHDLEIIEPGYGIILKDQNYKRFRLTLETKGNKTDLKITPL